MRIRRLLLALWIGWLGCRPHNKPDVAPALAAEDIWVDAASTQGGDGSAQRPFKKLADALARSGEAPIRIHLAAGLYAGPFRTAGPVQLIGAPSSILFVEGAVAVLVPAGEIDIQGVAVQGGSLGIEADRRVGLRGVRFSGQRSAAVLLRSGALAAEASTFSASISESRGVVLEGDATAEISGCAFLGPYRRAVESRSRASVRIRDSRFDGPVTGVQQTAGAVLIQRTSFAGGRGPAVFAAHGTLALVDVDVHGHEYGVQCGEGAALTANRFSSTRANRAGIALVKASAELEEVLIAGSGSFGGLQLVNASASLRRFWISGAEAYGIHARDSRLAASDGAITQTKDQGGDAGDAVHLRGGTAALESISIRNAAGAGVLAAEAARLSMRDVSLENCRLAGLVAETLAKVQGSSVLVRNAGGAAIAVPSEAEVQVDVLSSEHNSEGAVWAECGSGARVVLSRLSGDAVGGTGSRCVRIAASPWR